jgi:hypothetical protein
MTTFPVEPVLISLPPMMIGMSTVSAAMLVRRAFSSARATVPGA